MNALLHNAVIFNRDSRFVGYLMIEDERIKKVREGLPDNSLISSFGDSAFDMHGHWLFPGVIDSHVHFREPGMTNKADIASESKAAIAGGVTSFMEMPNTFPPALSMREIERKIDIASKKSAANYAFFIGASADNIEELRNADYSRIPGIKLFLGSSTGNLCVSDEKVLDDIFSLPHLIAVHCEDEATINRNADELKALYGKSAIHVAWHSVVRSELACYKSAQSAVERAKRLNTRLHFCHITTEEELALADGEENISKEVCLPHLWFTDEDYDRKGTLIKCNPAVKSNRHRKALRKALTTGAVDVVNTDHAPHALEEKKEDLFLAPSGMPMVQFSLRAMLQLARDGVLSPERVVRLMSHNQAELFKIKDRGYLDEGNYADIVEINPHGTDRPVEFADVVSKCGWTPLVGETLNSTIERVWVNGTIAYASGCFTEGINSKLLEFT